MGWGVRREEGQEQLNPSDWWMRGSEERSEVGSPGSLVNSPFPFWTSLSVQTE